MAIKQYEPGQVKNENLPSVRFTAGASPDMFGAAQAQQIKQVGAAIGDASNTLAYLAKESQRKRDTAVVRDTFNQAQDEALQYSTSVFQQKGKDAIDSYEDARKAFSEMRKRYSQDMKDTRQRELFDASFDSIQRQHLNAIMDHQEKQRQIFETETLDAENKMAHDMAVAYRNRAQDIRLSEETISANTAFKYRGMGDTVIKQKTKEAMHAMHADIIDAFIKDGQPDTAGDYVKKNRDRFNEAMLPEIEDKIKKSGDNKWILETAVNLNGSGKSLEDQLVEVDKAGKGRDIETVEKLRQEVKQRYSDMEKIKNARIRETVEAEWDKLFADPYNYRIPQELPANEQTAMLNYRRSLLNDAVLARGVDIPANGDSPLLKELMTLPPEKFAAINLSQFSDRLSSQEYRQAAQMQRNARLDLGSAKSQEYFRARSMASQAKDAIEGMKYFDTKKTGGKMHASQFYQQFDAAINLIDPKERTTEAIDEILKKMLAPVSGVRGAKFSYELAYTGSGTYHIGQKIRVDGKVYRVTGGDLDNDPDLEEIK